MRQVLVADDHGLYRRGLRIAMEAAIPEISVLEANCMDTALTILEEAGNIDLALIDLNMHGIISFGVLKEVRRSYTRTRFIIISASRNRVDILEALNSGLHGFICKTQSDAEVIAAISDVLSGRIYVPPLLANLGVNADESPSVPEEKINLERHLEMNRLTPRQRDVLNLIADGLSNKEIARKLAIAEATTKIHAAALMRALGVRNRTEAAVLARSWLEARQ